MTDRPLTPEPSAPLNPRSDAFTPEPPDAVAQRRQRRRRLGVALAVLGGICALLPSFMRLHETDSLGLAFWLQCDTETPPFTESFAPNLQLRKVDGQWQATFSLRVPGTRGGYPVGLCNHKYLDADHPFSVWIEGKELAAEPLYETGATGQVWRVDFRQGLGGRTDGDMTIRIRGGLLRRIDGAPALHLYALLGVDDDSNDAMDGVAKTAPIHVFVHPGRLEFLSEVEEMPVDFRLQGFRGDDRLVEYRHREDAILRARLQRGWFDVFVEAIVFVGGALFGLGATLLLEEHLSRRRTEAERGTDAG